MEHATSKPRKKISPEASLAAYGYAKKVIEKQLTFTEARDQLAEEQRMNPNSAVGLINNVKAMVKGEEYKRTTNLFTVSLILSRIQADFGDYVLAKALGSVEKHIDYYENRTGTTLRSLRQLIIDQWAKPSPETDAQEQEEIISRLTTEHVTENILISRLKQLPLTSAERITVNSHSYRRNNYAVALLKMIRRFSCQICGTTIPKMNGFYAEAAHITPKHEGGDESPQNILILCPNHHKEFDLGDTQILQRSADRVVFMMNGTRYDLSLLLQ